MAPKDKI